MAFSPTPKSAGDLVRSKDWNEAMDEIVRLESAKLGTAGGKINGSLSVQSLNVGTLDPPKQPLTVRGATSAFLLLSANNSQQELMLGADATGGIISTMTNHDLQLRAGGNVTRLTVKADGKVGIGTDAPGFGLDVTDRIRLRQGTAPSAGLWLFQTAPSSDRAFIGMADDNTLGLFGNSGPIPNWGFKMNTASFDITLNGNLAIRGSLTAGGGKGGFVVDNFINAVGETLEQGDVVIVGGKDVDRYYGVGNSIPVPEVDLTDQAYDTRVCGIVDTVVQADSLPPYDMQIPTEEEVQAAQAEKNARRRKAAEKALADRLVNPLTELAAPVSADLNVTQVQAGQLGRMVTLGAYAWCKVDADIAPIAVGDLLTTSPTRGHAQKVTEPARATGAILGKALSARKKGKGKIPVLVLLQ